MTGGIIDLVCFCSMKICEYTQNIIKQKQNEIMLIIIKNNETPAIDTIIINVLIN